MKRNYTQEDYKSGKLNITANYVSNVLPGKSSYCLYYTHTQFLIYMISRVALQFILNPAQPILNKGRHLLQ